MDYVFGPILINYNLCCRDKQGGSITRPSCFIRWDVHPFAGAFENLTLPPPQPQSLPQPPLSLPPPVSDLASKTDKGKHCNKNIDEIRN